MYMVFQKISFNNRRIRVGKGGFTLIELLVVIAIIGVLASIVLASLNTARRKSRDARRVTDIKQLQLALELYYDAQTPPQYPAYNADCTANGFGLNVLAPNYIPQVPRDPTRVTPNNCYLYGAPGGTVTRNAYHLGGILEDSGHQALKTDRDFNSTTEYSGSGGFNGATGDCAAGTGDEACYDVVP